MTTLDDVARAFVGLLERLGVRYALMGGMAVRLYALPRATFDVDLVAAISRDGPPGFLQAAEQVGLSSPESQHAGWLDTVRGLPVCRLQWLAAGRPLDIGRNSVSDGALAASRAAFLRWLASMVHDA